MEGERMHYIMRTPNHHTGNLIRNMAKLFGLVTTEDENGLLVIRDEVPCYFDGSNRRMYILRLGGTKVANIFPDGIVELKASVPAISKTLMSQTKDYRLGVEKTLVKTYIRSECKFRTDLHTHMNGNLPPELLIALGVMHQIRYPYYYVKKLGLRCTAEQLERLETARKKTAQELCDIPLTGRHRERRFDDLTFINFADLILGNPVDAADNIKRIRNSLTIPKDGQAVFANLEKVYLYRYVFTKGIKAEDCFAALNTEQIPNREVRTYAACIRRDRADVRYRQNTLYQDLLLWIAREYRRYGIEYAEITDTSLLNKMEFPAKLRQIHELMPNVTRETGVLLRFLAGIRRTPLTIVRDRVTPGDYLAENLRCLSIIAQDPYVAGADIIGEEINDILEMRNVIGELVRIADAIPGFVIRIHAGENDSLRDNVANSIRCVKDALRDGQEFPAVRIGHGLYTCDLKSGKGTRLLEELKENAVTLEFQISSNVRLNNLSSLENHPLRQYLKAGVHCVQGTDGGALYGTNSIDEELSLEKLLGLRLEELCSMRRSEDEILAQSLRIFDRKTERFRSDFPSGDPERHYQRLLEETEQNASILWQDSGKIDAEDALREQITELPEDGFPVIVAGGSFNNSSHRSTLRQEDRDFLDALLEGADPEKTIFVIGQNLSGHEAYLVQKAVSRFRIFAIVPRLISRAEKTRLQRTGVGVLLSIENSPMGLYKSFAYEIFKRRPSALLAFDGNSAALNLIQEARNGREKCRIYINLHSRGLAVKIKTLEGYVQPLCNAELILKELGINRE